VNARRVRSAAVSIDVDPLGGDALWDRAMPRWLDALERHGLRATFFVVSAELARPAARRSLLHLVRAGHEVASHSAEHPRRFGSLDRAETARQIDHAARAIEDACGVRVVGFRAPAWDASATHLSVLEERGYLYDSSVCPTWCAPLARAVVRHRGTRSFGDRRFALAPRAPYHPDAIAPWRAGAMRLLELPTSIGTARLPVWFSLALATGASALGAWMSLLASAPTPQWLFHAADLLDFGHDVPASLSYRPGLRRSLREKQSMIDRVLVDLQQRFHVRPLEEIARAFG
jgi:hypothetical protein